MKNWDNAAKIAIRKAGRKQRVLEKHIEGAVVQYARSLGVHVIKNATMYSNGFPDRTFLFGDGGMLLIEFKVPGAKLTPLQKDWHGWLKKNGHRVEVVDNVEEGKRLIDEVLEQLNKWRKR